MTSRNALVLGVLVACSGDHHHGVDASPLDAPTDTLAPSMGQPPPDAVAIHMTQLGQPVANAAVYFQTPDSTLVLATTTDQTGIAWALASDGDVVTAIEPSSSSGVTELSTFAGVRKGDRLELALQPVSTGAGSSVTLHVPVQGGALAYQIHNPCGDDVTIGASGSGPATFSCGAGTLDLVVVPTDSIGAPLGALFAANVVVTDGTGVTVPGAYAAFDNTTFTYTNVPATVGYVETYQAIVTPRGRVFDATASAAPANGTAITALQEPHTPANTTALTVTIGVPPDTETSEQSVFEWRPWGATYNLDLGAQRLPEYAATPGFDLGRSRVTWTERTGGLAPTLVRANVNLYRDGIPAGRRWTWRIVAPRTGIEVALPHLPVADLDFNPGPGDTVTVEELTNALVPGGYDAVRARAFDDLVRVVSIPSGMMIVEGTYSPPL